MARRPLISPTARITLGLAGLCASMVFFASTLGFLGDKGEKIESRKQFAESLAIGFSSLAQRTDNAGMRSYFEAIVERNSDLTSIGIRQPKGGLILATGDHPKEVPEETDKALAETRFKVPVFNQNKKWGELECHFERPPYSGWMAILNQPEFKLVGFLLATCVPLAYGYLRFVLRHLNPSKVVPSRVREALDSLAEGLIVVDKQGRVVMANRAFQEATGIPWIELVGNSANELPFSVKDNPSAELPWLRTLEDGTAARGQILEMESTKHGTQTFSVSCTAVEGDTGERRGAMISLENVTELENQRERLGEMVVTLQKSGAKIVEQNRELEILATRDALTGCLNRRSFFTLFDDAWSEAVANGQPLSAMMVDIDHFKSVNDNHGHAMGDSVLKAVGRVLREATRESDIVSRYGGEEFSIVLPHTSLDEATVIAEQIREAIEQLEFINLKITTSLGLSGLCQNPSDTQDMLEQADKCLYFAKRNGRNQVARWDTIPHDIEMEEGGSDRVPEESEETTELVPFRAVSALISALAFRDQETASHSRRVADLCVLIGEGLISMRDCYVLEIAGLLHDIGKIGVPDSILLKPDALTDEEWKIMRRHERIGVEIIKRSFGSEELNKIIRSYRLPYQSDDSSRPSGADIPIGARILSVADAYDAMTSDRVFREGMTHQRAISELRGRSGSRFDPRLVDRLDERMAGKCAQNSRTAATVTKDAALSIGLQMESLSAAIDDHDSQGVAALAKRLSHTALKHGVNHVAVKANELANQSDGAVAEAELIAAANELLDMCRSTQSALLDASMDTKFFAASPTDTKFFSSEQA